MVLAGGPAFPVPSLVGANISTMSYVVRSTISSSELMPLVQRATYSVDPQLALAQVRTLQDVLDRASAQMAFTMVHTRSKRWRTRIVAELSLRLSLRRAKTASPSPQPSLAIGKADERKDLRGKLKMVERPISV
jgi:hypothetical protein